MVIEFFFNNKFKNIINSLNALIPIARLNIKSLLVGDEVGECEVI